MKINLKEDDVKLFGTIIKKIVICVLIGLLLSLFYDIINKKTIDIRLGILVAIVIAIINL